MRKKISFALLIAAALSMVVLLSDPFPRRGVNNVLEWVGAAGTGTETDPYIPSTLDMGFELSVSMGMLPGYTLLDKFGSNPVISTGPEDIWEGGGLYNYDAFGTAPIVSLISSNATDDYQSIRITGLDITGAEVTQTLMLDGLNRVALTTPLWRVYRMENEADEGGDLAGTAYCYVGTGGVPIVADQRAIIDNGNNQTLMALYTVPLGKVGFLYRGESGINWEGSPSSSGEFANVHYYSRRVGKVFKVKKDISLMSNGNSNYQDRRSFPDIIPALTDIRLSVQEVSESMGVWATFDMLLVDEGLFTAEYLQAIGQQGY